MSLEEKAKRLGISARAFVDLASDDSRAVASEVLSNASGIDRLAHFLSIGLPHLPDGDLCFDGPEHIRAAFMAVLDVLPAWCRHTVLSCCHVVAIDPSRARGVCHYMPSSRPDPDHDRARLIVLSDADSAVHAHEIHHLVSSPLIPPGSKAHAVSPVEAASQAACIAGVYSEADATHRLEKQTMLRERAADRFACFLGFHIDTCTANAR